MSSGFKLADGSLSTNYQVGDSFIVTGKSNKGEDAASKGDKCVLIVDDKSHRPLFEVDSQELGVKLEQWIFLGAVGGSTRY